METTTKLKERAYSAKEIYLTNRVSLRRFEVDLNGQYLITDAYIAEFSCPFTGNDWRVGNVNLTRPMSGEHMLAAVNAMALGATAVASIEDAEDHCSENKNVWARSKDAVYAQRLNSRYVKYIQKRYPAATMYISPDEENKPVVWKVDGKPVAMLMPMLRNPKY